MTEIKSSDVARAALTISMTQSRQEEETIKKQYKEYGIRSVAVDFGGEFLSSIPKIIERAVVSARREGVISDGHTEEGAVAGATHEAISQISSKVIGMNVGGKIGIARYGEHVVVAVFFLVGLLNLNDVCVGLGHRAL